MGTKSSDRVITSSVPQMDAWTEYLNDTVGKMAPFKVVPADMVAKVPRPALSMWCETKGLWLITTQELVDYCKTIIKDRPALEICAGRGSLGAALNIPQIDSNPTPGTQVQSDSALNAVQALNPQVVVAAWSTQQGSQEVPYSAAGGVDEAALVPLVACYILVGNKHVHGLKKVMALPHQEQHFDWLVSRSTYPMEDTLYTWGA